MSIKLKKKEEKARKEKHFVAIGFPEENELISNSDYSIRIEASDSGFVLISIDNGEWVSCYNSVGYWWHDWAGYTQGDHTIIARLCDENGCVIKESETRHCRY